jgi:hypothetical protein
LDGVDGVGLLVCGADNGYDVVGLVETGTAIGALDNNAQATRVAAASEWLSKRSLRQAVGSCRPVVA